MSNVMQLISQLGAAGIKVWLDEENQLRFKAPKGALTDELKQQLLSQKEQVINFLRHSKTDQNQSITAIERNPQQLYPLSMAQQRFWFLDRLEPGNPSLHIPAAIRISGPLHIAHLQSAIEHLLARHESLRTSLILTDSLSALQQIHAPFAWPLQENYDLSHLASTEQEQHLQELMTEEILKPFDLYAHNTDSPSLMRTTLVRLSLPHAAQAVHVLLITLHHIIADGWSLGLLIRELTSCYGQLQQHITPAHTALPISYIDFSAWQQQWIANHTAEHLAFWKQQLKSVPHLQLPTDFIRPKKNTHQGSSVSFNIDAATANALKNLAHQHNLSLFIVLLSAFKVLLHRYSQQDDICVGTPVAGRNRHEIENIIGCFINLLAIRSPIDATAPFSQFLLQVKNTLLAAQEHQDIPFEQVAEACTEQRSLAHTPIFQVLFTHQADDLQKQLHIDGLQLQLLQQASLTTKYDLLLHVDTDADILRGTVEFNTGLFLPTTISEFCAHYCHLLTAIVANPDNILQNLALLDAEQQRKAIAGHLGWPALHDSLQAARPLHQIFEQNATSHPEHTAFRCDNISLDYRQLNEKANQLAWELTQRLPANSGNSFTIIAICCERSAEMMIMLLAIMKAGFAYVPIDPEFPAERIHFILNDSNAALILTQPHLHGLFEHLSIPCLPLTTAHPLFTNGKTCNLSQTTKLSDLAYVLYTSGSTGNPKGVMIEHLGLFNYLSFAAQHYLPGLSASIVSSTLTFDATITTLFAPLLAGKTVIFTSPADQTFNELTELIFQANDARLFKITPAHMELLAAQHCGKSTPHRHIFVIGGEQLLNHQLQPWLQGLAPNAVYINEYGPTETVVGCCILEVSRDNNRYSERAAVPIGHAIINTRLYVLDRYGHAVPRGASGELYIASPGVARGYLNRADLNRNSFIANPFTPADPLFGRLYKTGDIVRYLADGELEYLGRSDDQVKIRGFRIELNEIEKHLSALPDIRESVVLAVDDGRGSKTLAAYYTSVSDADIAPTLRQQLAHTLPDYMIPSAFTRLQELPLTGNGKVDRKALGQIDICFTSTASYVAAHTATEKQLVEIWQQVLNLDHIGIHDNFFELGGHSLIATRLSGLANREFGIDLPLTIFFEKPTIAEMAAEIDRGAILSTSYIDTDIPVTDRSLNIPLSFAQERLWIIEQMAPGNTAYNIPFALHLSGALDKTALIKALNAIVERHESLRTMIRTAADGNACQDIRPASEFKVIERQLSSMPDQAALQAMIAGMASTVFDFSRDLLFRVELVSISTTEHILLACMHHIISDGWSLGILQNELQVLYRAFAGNTTPVLAALPHQYADFSAWQRQHAHEEQAGLHLEYWLTQLKDAPAFITLPTDKPRPEQQSFNGAMLTLDLPAHLAAKVSAYSQQHGTTAFNVLLGAYALLLGKYSRQDDICIGTPVSGRDKAGLQGMIGYFVNAVVIRSKLSGNPSFDELVERTQDTCLGAFAHQDVAIEQVLDKLHLPRSASYAPVAQVGFSFISNNLVPAPDIDKIAIKTLDIDKVVAKYDLTLIAVEKGNSLQLNLEYNTDLFIADSITRMYHHFVYLLEQCLAQPATTIKGISLLDSNALLDAVNASADEVESILPLTPMQHDMLMSQWLNPASLANTLGYRAEVDFEVDADIWENAIELVSLQQPVTRTHFRTSRFAYGDFAYQCVFKHLDIQLEVMDYRDEQLSEQQIQQRVDAFIYQPQAYQQQQFIRYGLMRLNGPRTILLLSSHHALLDGISIVLIAESTARYYEALTEHRPVNEVPNLPVAFADYVADNIQAIDNTDTRDFWQQRFKTCEALDFSVDTGQPSRQIIDVHYLDADLWKSLKGWCRKNRTTPAQLLKVVYAVLIANYCRASEDFYFSEFHAGRNRDSATALGCYFLQSPFIFAGKLLQQDTPITALLDYARDFRKTIKPFDAISMGLTRQLAPQGRLQFMFNYYHFFPQHQLLQGYPITCIETPPYIEQAVQFVIKEHENDCQLDLYYQTGSFADLCLLQRIEHLCAQIVAGVDTVGALSLVFAEEKEQQLHRWNATGHDLPGHTSVQAWFEQQVAATPSNVAVIDDGSSISYRELNAQANRIAHYLQAQGVGSDIRVGLCMNRCIDAIAVILGIIKAGGAYVPIDANYPEQRIQHMLDSAHIHLLFTQQQHRALFAQFTQTVVVIDDPESAQAQAIAQGPAVNLPAQNHLQDMLYVIFTSGSTGQPKGATVTHLGEINLLQWYTREFSFNAQSSNLIISAQGFDLTQKNLLAPLVSGGKLVLSTLEHYDSGAIHQLVSQHGITHINCAPSAFYPLIEDHNDFSSLQSLRTVIFGGEPINCDRLAKWFLSADCQALLVNNYGPTECTDIAAYYRVADIKEFIDKPMPIGKPNDNVQAYILNPLQQLLPAGLIGEICIAGSGVGRGYLNNDDLNQEKFIPNLFGEGQLYRTGDLGKFLPDGNMLFHVRADFQVKLNGLRIELGEIETVLRSQLAVSDALALVIDNQIAGYVTAPAGFTLPDDWKSLLGKFLPAYMVPQSLLALEKWPLTPNGKIDRKALPQPGSAETSVPYVAPRSDTEQVICDIVRRILGVERVGIHDNFFDLGGHSLAASRAIVQIREHFQMEIPLNVLFEMTTVEKLAAYIKASQWALQSAAHHEEDDSGRDTGFI